MSVARKCDICGREIDNTTSAKTNQFYRLVPMNSNAEDIIGCGKRDICLSCAIKIWTYADNFLKKYERAD